MPLWLARRECAHALVEVGPARVAHGAVRRGRRRVGGEERSGAERLLPALAKVKIWSVKDVERWGGALLFFGLEPDTDGLSWSSSSNKALSAAVGTLSKPSTLSRSQPSSKKASFLEELK